MTTELGENITYDDYTFIVYDGRLVIKYREEDWVTIYDGADVLTNLLRQFDSIRFTLRSLGWSPLEANSPAKCLQNLLDSQRADAWRAAFLALLSAGLPVDQASTHADLAATAMSKNRWQVDG